MSIPTAFPPTHELRLIALAREVGRAATMSDACATAVERLEAVLDAPCAIRAQDGAGWRVVASSRLRQGFGGQARLREGFGEQARLREGLVGHGFSGQARPGESSDEQAVQNDDDATIISLGQTPDEMELLISTAAGELPENADWCEALGGVLSTALQLVHMTAHRVEADRRADRVERFSRALVGISESATLHRAIVEQMAHAVDAEIGAMAVFMPQENSLAITATHGYPAVLVEHVRIAPGEGVLGRVFATGEPILVPNLNAMAGQITRRRYRTDSYIALPLAGPDGVVAVVSLTDRTAGAPFSENDLSVLRQMSIPAALAVARELLRDRTNDLAHLATVDALTGLFNRRYFETRLEQELQRQVRQPDDLSLLMLDLDNFKELNDTHGHLTGDLALREVAEILRRAVRIFDVCARFGGEEFVILMPGAGSSTALRIAERIRRQVEQHFATGLRSGVPVPLTVSVGVSTAAPSVTRDVLVAQADAALLRAKATGKNQVNLHEESTS